MVLWPATGDYFGTEFIITVATVDTKLIFFDNGCPVVRKRQPQSALVTF